MSEAPFFARVAEGPEDGRAFWLTTADGVKIRAGLWNAAGPRGTVFLLPGRTEYVEKYGRSAAHLARAGWATLSVDWRGQGLADKSLPDPMVGHVADFAEFQTDMQALLALAQAQGLPRPYVLLAHSMGGCIGLRSLMSGLPFASAAFSAPMWGILIAPWMRPLANGLSWASRHVGLGHLFAPGTKRTTYVLAEDFPGNNLTKDPDMWDYMRKQALAHPDLALGGPSLAWLWAALKECRALAAMDSPRYPTICALGTDEKIVDTRPIHDRMARWQGGRLDLYHGAEHEVLMERPPTREAFLESAIAHFEAHR